MLTSLASANNPQAGRDSCLHGGRDAKYATRQANEASKPQRMNQEETKSTTDEDLNESDGENSDTFVLFVSSW